MCCCCIVDRCYANGNIDTTNNNNRMCYWWNERERVPQRKRENESLPIHARRSVHVAENAYGAHSCYIGIGSFIQLFVGLYAVALSEC